MSCGEVLWECLRGAGALARLPRQQSFGIRRGHPLALFGDADRNDLIFILINGLENRRGREQRNFVLAAASAEKDAYTEFLHRLSAWTRGWIFVNRRSDS